MGITRSSLFFLSFGIFVFAFANTYAQKKDVYSKDCTGSCILKKNGLYRCCYIDLDAPGGACDGWTLLTECNDDCAEASLDENGHIVFGGNCGNSTFWEQPNGCTWDENANTTMPGGYFCAPTPTNNPNPTSSPTTSPSGDPTSSPTSAPTTSPTSSPQP